MRDWQGARLASLKNDENRSCIFITTTTTMSLHFYDFESELWLLWHYVSYANFHPSPSTLLQYVRAPSTRDERYMERVSSVICDSLDKGSRVCEELYSQFSEGMIWERFDFTSFFTLVIFAADGE